MTDTSTKKDNDFCRVHRAVAAGESAEEVRRLIEIVAQGGLDERRRTAAANTAGRFEGEEETPLKAAHRLRRGDLVGLLLEAGADAKKLFPNKSALAVCIAYGQVDSLRALLRSGKHDANETIGHRRGGSLDKAADKCTAAHLCICPPRLSSEEAASPPPQPACLEVLVREGGANVNARDWQEKTPLHWLLRDRCDYEAGLTMLVTLGADLNARDGYGQTPLVWYARWADLRGLRRLVGHGASVNMIDNNGWTPLMSACYSGGPSASRPEVVQELLCLSSKQTRRSVGGFGSAVDCIVDRAQRLRVDLETWEEQVIAQLLASGASVLPYHARTVLPIAVSLGNQQQAQISAWQSGRFSWRAHEAAVGLVLDARDASEADEAVEAAERRVEALEEELRELGGDETESESESESEGGSGSAG